MTSFKQIVKNYRQVYRLGNQIIQHKKMITQIPVKDREKEFLKQEQRIENFEKLTKKANTQWNKYKHTVDTYWTGFS